MLITNSLLSSMVLITNSLFNSLINSRALITNSLLNSTVFITNSLPLPQRNQQLAPIRTPANPLPGRKSGIHIHKSGGSLIPERKSGTHIPKSGCEYNAEGLVPAFRKSPLHKFCFGCTTILDALPSQTTYHSVSSCPQVTGTQAYSGSPNAYYTTSSSNADAHYTTSSANYSAGHADVSDAPPPCRRGV